MVHLRELIVKRCVATEDLAIVSKTDLA
jgi:hypothetical protein